MADSLQLMLSLILVCTVIYLSHGSEFLVVPSGRESEQLLTNNGHYSTTSIILWIYFLNTPILLSSPIQRLLNIKKSLPYRTIVTLYASLTMRWIFDHLLKSVHFNTFVPSSVLSKLASFSIINQLKSIQSQLMYY